MLSATGDVPWDCPCPEIELQLGGVRPSPDAFPGVILGRPGRTWDVLAASANALSLILEALDGVERAVRPHRGRSSASCATRSCDSGRSSPDSRAN